jgi:hypothetical protein
LLKRTTPLFPQPHMCAIKMGALVAKDEVR